MPGPFQKENKKNTFEEIVFQNQPPVEHSCCAGMDYAMIISILISSCVYNLLGNLYLRTQGGGN